MMTETGWRTDETLHRRPHVQRITGLSRSTIYAGIASGTFPEPVRIGKRAVAWKGSDLDAWVAACPRTGDGDQ
jgi:prophage regulatory protein